MKKYILILDLILINCNCIAQNLIEVPVNIFGQCGTNASTIDRQYSQAELFQARSTTTTTQYVFNVKVHFIANNVPASSQELKALDLIGALNVKYNQANIFFKYSGFDNINNNALLNIDSTNYATLWPLINQNFIDVFIANSLFGATSGMTGITFSTLSNNQIFRKMIVLKKDALPTLNSATPTNVDYKYFTAIHEMGHYLGLNHTFQQWKYENNVLKPAFDNECALEENYNNSQWATLGDLIQDTNPDRCLAKYANTSGTAPYNSTSCTINPAGWHPNTTCGTSINFSLFNPPVTNIMSYYSVCSAVLTAGQYDFVRAFINSEIAPGHFLQNKQNADGVLSLYAPFAQIAVGCGNGSLNSLPSRTPNSVNTGVNVLCCPAYTLRYQKGFTTQFTTVTNGIYTTFSKGFHEQQNNVNSNDGVQLKIPVVSNDLIDVIGSISCLSTFEPYVSGSVASTPALGSSNVIIKGLNATEVVDPLLIQTLDATEYHIITKETDSGFIDQKII